jgi:hypothetical protein
LYGDADDPNGRLYPQDLRANYRRIKALPTVRAISANAGSLRLAGNMKSS